MTRACPRARRCANSGGIFAALSASAADITIEAMEAAKATEILLSNHPGLTVERHLRNFHWKNPNDIAHYRDGLLKAGVPFARLTLVETGSKRAADS